MRLIDADAVIEMMRVQAGCESCDTYNGVRCRACPWDDAISVVDDYADNHPAADVVPVVRCKDCLAYESTDDFCYVHADTMNADEFCSMGTKRE